MPGVVGPVERASSSVEPLGGNVVRNVVEGGGDEDFSLVPAEAALDRVPQGGAELSLDEEDLPSLPGTPANLVTASITANL